MADDDLPSGSDPTLLSGPPTLDQPRFSLVPIAQVSDSPLAATLADGGDETLSAPPAAGGSPASIGGARLKVVSFQNYSIEEEVATGGIGRIMRARDTYLNRPVALKEILRLDVSSQERFIREARITARLQHPSIVPVYEAGKWPSGEPFYAMKLVTGQSFDKTMAEAQTLDQRLALLPHVIAVAEAMAYAHHERIIHRDLKPQNVLSGPFGETVVIDWGLAKDLRNEPPDAAEDGPLSLPLPQLMEDSPALTMEGAIVGTPAYMPPEQAEGRAVDERADVYAIGAILYHLLAGRAPFQGMGAYETLKAVRAGPPTPIEQVQPGVPRDLATIVQKAMAHKRSMRYRTAAELALDLRRFQTGQIVEAHHYSRRERLIRFAKKNSREILIAAGALVTLCVVATALVLRIVAARDDARRERDRAALAEMRESSRADRLTLLSARAAVLKEPLETLAWLKTLSPAFQDARRARAIAADAIAHGIPRLFRGHRLGINHGDFSADGKWIVTTSDDHDGRIWDMRTGMSRALLGHKDEVWSLRLSKDGKRILTGAKDGVLREFDWETGEGRVLAEGFAEIDFVDYAWDGRAVVRDRAGNNALVDPIQLKKTALYGHPRNDGADNRILSPDGRTLAFGVKDAIVFINLETTEHRAIPWPGDAIHGLDFSSDGTLLALATSSGRVALLDMRTETLSFFEGHQASARNIFFFPQSHQWVTAGFDGLLRVWDAASGSSRAFHGHEGPIYHAAVSHHGRFALTSGADHIARLWDVRSGAVMSLRGAKDALSDVEFAPDDRSFLVAGYDGSLRVYSFDTLRDGIVATHDAVVERLLVSPDGQAAVSVSSDGRVLVTSVLDGKTLANNQFTAPIFDIAFSPDGKSIAIALSESRIAILSRAGEPLRFLEGIKSPMRHIRYAPNGRSLLSASKEGGIFRFAEGGGAPELLFERSGSVDSLSLSPDGALVAAGYADGSLVLFDLQSRTATTLAAHRGSVSSVAFSPSGKWLCSGSMDHSVRLWDSKTKVSLFSIDAAGTGIRQVLFFPDETKIATLGGETNVRLWSAEDGRSLAVLRGQRSVVESLALSPEGNRIAAGARDGSIFLWDLEIHESRSLEGHKGAVAALAFADQGRMLLSGASDQTVRRFMDDLPIELPALRAAIEKATPETVHSLGIQSESQ